MIFMKLVEYVDFRKKENTYFTVSWSGHLLQVYAPFKFSFEKVRYLYSS